jgi:glycosyltransferase involved in cell wall biosynthesis
MLIKSGEPPELLVIGNLQAGNIDTIREQMHHPNIKALGFIPDLSNVMRPYDIHVIPYEYNTGTRTRLPVALNYNQVLISTRKAVEAFAGLEHMHNCILVDSLEEMAEYVRAVYEGKIQYKQIADNGRKFFEQEFTVGGQKNRLKNFLDKIYSRTKPPVR